MVLITPSSSHHSTWITEGVKPNHTTSGRRYFNGSGT
jgi:hypothetical protein